MIYFLRAGNGRIKIGRTSGPVGDRIRQLQTGCPEPLECLGVLPCGKIWSERHLHRRFSHLRGDGEWFEADPELLDFIHNRAEFVEVSR